MSNKLILDRNAFGCQSLAAFWPIANGSSEVNWDLVQGLKGGRDNVAEENCTLGEEVTPDGIWMPHYSLVTDAHADIDFAPRLNLFDSTDPAFTVLIWGYPVASAQRMLFFNSGSDPRFYLATNTGSVLFVGLGDSFDTSMSAYVLDKWQLFSLSYDGTNCWTTVDGLAKSTASFSGSKTVGNASANIELGNATGSIGHWNSKIGPIAIYHRALDDFEIRQIRNDFWRAYLGQGPSGLSRGGAMAELIYEVSAMQVLETNFAPTEKISGTNVEKLVVAFDDSTEEYRNGKFIVPSDVDTAGTVNLTAYVFAKTAAASKNIQLRFGHVPIGNGEDFDGSYTNEDSGDVAINATQDYMTKVEWTETISNLGWAAEDIVYFRISRIDATANDLTGDMYWDTFEIEIPVN